MYLSALITANVAKPVAELGSGSDPFNENGNPIDDDGDDEDHYDDHNDDDVSIGDVDNNQGGNDENDNDNDEIAQSKGLDSTHTESDKSQDHSKQSDGSNSTWIIIGIVISCFCLFVITLILSVFSIVYLRYKRRRPNFVVTHDNPKILMASDMHNVTTSIPKSYLQSPRFSPKGYEPLPITDYEAVQPDIKKPVY